MIISPKNTICKHISCSLVCVDLPYSYVWSCMFELVYLNNVYTMWQIPNDGVDTVIQKSSRSSGHQSSRHRSRDKSRDRDQDRDRDRDKDWPPEKLSDSHSPVSLTEEIQVCSAFTLKGLV